MRKPYSTDLSDAEWIRLRSYLPTPKAQGRPRTYSLRAVLDAIFYLLRTGCPWRYLPREFPPWQTVYYHFRRFRLSGMWHRILTAPCSEVGPLSIWGHDGYSEDSLVRQMDTVERSMLMSKTPWVNIIARRCRTRLVGNS